MNFLNYVTHKYININNYNFKTGKYFNLKIGNN